MLITYCTPAAVSKVGWVEYPMCRGLRSCRECDGLGDDTCVDWKGRGGSCDECNGGGKVICEPCKGSGACPRYGGEGKIEPLTAD